MIFNVGFLRRFLFGLSVTRMDTQWDGFGSETDARKQLRLSSNSFINGYNTALEVGLTPLLFSELQAFDPSLRGFAYEGAGMGMAMLDYTTLGNRSRLLEFIERSPKYTVLPHMGAGFAIAVLNRGLQSTLAPLDPMQRWWAIDGYGFYNGINRWEKTGRQWVPNKIKGYGQRAFDRGVGRSIWFRLNDDIDSIVRTIQSFPEHRRADLWSGIGVASTYAGGVGRSTLEDVKAAAGCYASYLPLGSSLAAMTRYYTNNIVAHNTLACSVYCGMTAEEAAQRAITIAQDLVVDPNEPVFAPRPIFETFREAVRSQFVLVPVAIA